MSTTTTHGASQVLAGRILERLRRALSQFLTIPLLVVLVFIGLAFAVHVADVKAGSVQHWGPVWSYFARYAGDPSSATSLLSAIASGLITVTSITFSILLLAVQQGASALNSQIIDNYLRRRSNQVYFGCFVGVSIFTLITLVLTTSSLRPVLGVMTATVLAGAALFSLIPLIYSTIEQTKPVTIITNMHDRALETRCRQLEWLRMTVAAFPNPGASFPIVTACNGYLTRVRIKSLRALIQAHPELRIHIAASIGDYLVCGAILAIVEWREEPDEKLTRQIRAALPVEEQRDVAFDAAFAVDQIGTIAWTSISTAKSNPAAALIACQALQDILYRWSGDPVTRKQDAESASLSYRDNVGTQLLNCFESILVVTSESMQHQSLSVAMNAISESYPRMHAPWKDRAEEILLTSLAALGDHLPTETLRKSFAQAAHALRNDGRTAAATRITEAWNRLEATRGTIHSRGNCDAQ